MYEDIQNQRTYAEAGMHLGANILTAAAGAGLMYKAGIFGELGRGINTSLLGADPLFSAARSPGGASTVFSFGENASEMLAGTRRGYGTLIQETKGGLGYKSLAANAIDDVFTFQGSNKLARGGLTAMGRANLIMPLAFTGIGAVAGGIDRGLPGVGEYLIQDFFAMDAAAKVNNMVFEFGENDVGAVASNFEIDAGDLAEKIKDSKGKGAFTVQRTMFGSHMLGMMRTMMGGVMGAAVGMEIGKAAGKGLANLTSTEGYGEGAAGLAGGIFGASIGAKIGAYAAGSFARMGVFGVGIAATTMVAKGTYSMLEAGFAKQGKGRGLNFASDTSQFMTQRAVTMRERAMQAMHKSHLNARSAFGQEATITHMNRDMFSHYKRY